MSDTGFRLRMGHFGGLAVAVALGHQAFIILSPHQTLLEYVFSRDDAYYYFRIAQNTVELGFPTFDGLHRSSGVQFLWYILLVALAWAVPDPISFLYAVLFLGMAFSAGAAILLWHAMRSLHSVRLADLSMFPFAGLLIERWHTMNGMEYPLHLVIIMAIIWFGARLFFHAEARTTGALVVLSALLALNYWTRLDAVIFSVFAWAGLVWAIWRGPGRMTWRHLAALSLIPGLAALAYIAMSYWMADTALPISGAVKRVYAEHYLESSSALSIAKLWVSWLIKIQIQQSLVLVPDMVWDYTTMAYNPLKRPAELAIPLALIAGLTWLGLTLYRRSTQDPLAWRLMCIALAILAIGNLHIFAMIVAIGDFSHVSTHYYAWEMVAWLLIGALALNTMLATGTRLATLAATFLIALGAGGWAFQGASAMINIADPNTRSYSMSRYLLAQKLNPTLPADTRVGAWNAGALGYFLQRPVVPLDGIVNDRDFLERMEQDLPIRDYLIEQRIEYLIDHNNPDLTLRRGQRRDETTPFRNLIDWADLELVDQIGEIRMYRFTPVAAR